MLNFRSLELTDIPLVRNSFQQIQTRICDETIGGLFMWRHYYHIEIAESDGMIFFRCQDPDYPGFVFSVPCNSMKKQALNMLLEYCSMNHEKTVLYKVAQPFLDRLTAENFELHIQQNADYSDYLYTIDEMCRFPGSHFSGQRNHIHQFIRAVPRYAVEEITEQNVAQVADFLNSFAQIFPETDSYGQEELKMTMEVLEHFSQYGMFGILLRSEKDIIGFSLGEIVYDTVFVHIEKADRRIRGSYAMLVNSFAKYCAEKYPFLRYMNREEDVGDPGLRKSKLSYKPVKLLQKYTVEIES